MTLMGMRTAQVRRDMERKSQRIMRRKRRNMAASKPILSMSSGSLVWMRGETQPKIPSEIRGGLLSPTWYLTLGS